MTARILLIEDDKDIASALTSVLGGANYQVRHVPNGLEGTKVLDSGAEFDLVITDMMMPKMGGFPVLDFMSSMDDRPRVIMITANEGGRHKAYAEMLGVNAYVRKPFAMDVLLDTVRRVLADEPEPSQG